MLCMPEILNSLTAKQAKELAAACTQKISKIVNDENSPYSVSTTMYLAAVSQYAASEEFAEIVNASSGAKRYIEEGILVPDEIFFHIYISHQKRDRRTNSAAIPFHFNFG